MNIKKYIAELIGTFALALVVSLASTLGLGIVTTFLAGVTLALFVYSIGHLSGSHINPAVTIGAFSIKKISWQDAIMYIIAQFAGAALAIIVFNLYHITRAANLPP
ncbi:MAG: aquaporin, partial [Candidatus Pacebacteria bacterium]|nr:aquaporin [Candidatus Paceibacterota bacterium]